MFESSVQNLDSTTASLQKWVDKIKTEHEANKITAFQRIAVYNAVIHDQTAPPVERLRALVGNVTELSTLQRTSGEIISLNYILLLANSLRIFQAEVTQKLNQLKTQTSGNAVMSEEPQKYAEIDKELQRIKHMIDEEWKPLFDELKDAVDKERKFLDEHR
jgi:hypothetical protein